MIGLTISKLRGVLIASYHIILYDLINRGSRVIIDGIISWLKMKITKNGHNF